MVETSEREDYEQLLVSPGWMRFVAFARKQWGAEGYGVRVKQAIGDAKKDGIDLAEAVARVDAANEEINRLLSYPQTRAQALLAQEHTRKLALEPPLSRRGTL